MQDTVKQDRDKYIGGSDIPVIMNLSPFKSRFNLLLEKAGYKEDDFTGNEYTDYGNTLEPMIRNYINCELGGDPFVEGKHIREAGDAVIGYRCHTDGERLEGENIEVLEIKTTSQIYDTVDEYKLYLVQLLFYMDQVGAQFGKLAVYDRPDDMSIDFDPERLYLYIVNIDDYKDLVSDIYEAISSFCRDLVKVKANPFITEDELLPKEISDIARDIISFETQLDYLKSVEAKIKSEKARLKAAMVAANVKSWTTPNGYKITVIPDGEDSVTSEDYLDVDGLKRDLPELFKTESDGGYMKTREVYKKGRAGYVKIAAPKKGGRDNG